ncbi:DUF3592 domain-containing protein [Desulfosarcina ovata]|nr:DUF3592 domain-containing protein [Desulfosarcina ovata]
MNSPKALQTNKSKSRFVHLSGVSGKADRGMIFLILGMFVAGVVMMAWGGFEIKGSRESGSWPTAQGTISASSVGKRTTRDSNHRTKTTYYPKVGYHYQVEGRKYSSTRIAFGVGESGGSMKWAQKIVNKYPVGKTVTVYYNPQDPPYGVLESGTTWRSIVLLLAGAVFFIVGVLCVKAKLRRN